MMKMERGRPTKETQDEIKLALRPYYRMGVSPWKASIQTGHNYKTCLRYWKLFHDQVIEEEEPDIAIRQREAINQFKTGYDDVIFNLNVQLNEIIGLRQAHRKKYDEEVAKLKKENKEIPLYKLDFKLEDKFTELNKLLADLVEKKADALLAPYID